MADGLSTLVQQRLKNTSLSNSTSASVVGIVLIGIGLIGTGIMLAIHFFSVSHGSTGQVIVDNQMKSYAINIGVFITLALFGVLLYEYFNTQKTKQYILMFGLTMLSLSLAYSSFLSSLYQVKI